MHDLYIPTLHTFAMNNIFTGSCGTFRFRVVPHVVMATSKEVNFEESNITAVCWHGPFCFEKSEMEEEKTFPMTEEGRLSMKQWLESHI